MAFEWDAAKARSNLLKHGVDFEDAIRIFEGPTSERRDTRRDYRETRVLALGQFQGHVMCVVYAERGQVRRIISARGANRHEREAYRQTIQAP